MKTGSGRSTDFLALPAEEAERTLEALKQAEKTNDIEALKWCARRLVWLDEVSEIISGEDDYYPEHLFNKAWRGELKHDPPPASIAGIIARIDEPPETPDARKAIETLEAFFEASPGTKSFKAACASLDALREAVKKAEAVQ